MMSQLILNFVVILLLTTVSISNAEEAPSHKCEVLNTIDNSGYTYINCKDGGQLLWVATPKTNVKTGDLIETAAGDLLTNFMSKPLNMRFDKLIFTTSVRVRDRLEEERQRAAEEKKQLEAQEYDRQHPEIVAQRMALEDERHRQEMEDRRQEREEQRERDREQQAYEDEQQRQKAADDADFNRTLKDSIAGLGRDINQGLQGYGNAVQTRIDAENYAKQQREQQAREAREEQDRINRERSETARQRAADAERQAEQQRAADEQARQQQIQDDLARQQQAYKDASQKFDVALNNLNKNVADSGKWVDATYKVTPWGSDKMYLDTYLTATVTDSKGEPAYHGQYLSIDNVSQKYSANYATTVESGTLVPGVKKLIHIPFDNGSGANQRNTEYNINIKYFVPDNP